MLGTLTSDNSTFPCPLAPTPLVVPPVITTLPPVVTPILRTEPFLMATLAVPASRRSPRCARQGDFPPDVGNDLAAVNRRRGILVDENAFDAAAGHVEFAAIEGEVICNLAAAPR